MYSGPGQYQHYKGSIYEAIGLASDANDGRIRVVYEDKDWGMWTRDLDDFNAKVSVGGKSVDRFERILEGADDV